MANKQSNSGVYLQVYSSLYKEDQYRNNYTNSHQKTYIKYINIHSKLLIRIKPIVIILCDCKAITVDIMILLYNGLFVTLSQRINSLHLL